MQGMREPEGGKPVVVEDIFVRLLFETLNFSVQNSSVNLGRPHSLTAATMQRIFNTPQYPRTA